MIRVIVMDIEGTTSSMTAVHDRLFPYSRARIAGWLAEHRDSAMAAELTEEVRALAGRPLADESAVAAQLMSWLDADVKARPLKRLQGVIWHDGFQTGELRGHVYPEVPAALVRWSAAGIALYSYSSGTVTAQRDWFARTNHGNLAGYFRDHFDLTNAGPKQDSESYRRISAHIEIPPANTLFLTDLSTELDAAAEAGWQTVGIRRTAGSVTAQGHRWVDSFADVGPRGVPVG